MAGVGDGHRPTWLPGFRDVGDYDVTDPSDGVVEPTMVPDAARLLMRRGLLVTGLGIASYLVSLVSFTFLAEPFGAPPDRQPITSTLFMVAGIVGTICAVIGVGATIRWARRIPALQDTTWCRSRVTIRRTFGGRYFLRATGPEATHPILTLSRPLGAYLRRRIMVRGHHDVWVGGADTAVAVVFDHGPLVVAARVAPHSMLSALTPSLSFARRRRAWAGALTAVSAALLPAFGLAESAGVVTFSGTSGMWLATTAFFCAVGGVGIGVVLVVRWHRWVRNLTAA